MSAWGWRRLVREARGGGGGVASEVPLASAIAVSVLERGGNAVDSAVALAFALAVVAPHLGGVGGDFFALVRSPEGSVYFFNGSGYAPRRLTRELLLERGYREAPARGPLSITVPGFVGGVYTLWKKLGTMEWRDLVDPAAQLARRGFPVTPGLARAIRASIKVIGGDPGSRESYLPGGQPPRPWQPLRLPGLARLLDRLGEDPNYLYRGEPAEKLEEYVVERGGVLSSGDLRSYHAVEGEPVSLEYRGWRIWEMPPNTQGVTTLHVLGILEAWEIPRTVEGLVYYLLSAAGPSYWVRDRELGDPEYMRLRPEALLSHSYLEVLRSIASRGPPTCPRPPRRGVPVGDTTFYAVVDRKGWIVAGIQSLYMPFGSGLTEPIYQVTLNGRASGFTLEQGLPNTLEPGKRPLHTLSAMILESPDGEWAVSLGTSGGHYRPQQHAILAVGLVDWGLTPGEAIAMPRILWEPWTCKLVADDPEQAGRAAPPGYWVTSGRTGVAAAAWRGEGRVGVATDWRGDGFPALAAPRV